MIIDRVLYQITLADGTSAAGNIISELDTAQGSKPLGSVQFGLPFNDGLTVVTTGGVEVTVIYE